MKKIDRLRRNISRLDSIIVAFSGGVDSAFLLKIASDVLPQDKLLAVTAVSATYPDEELRAAKALAKTMKVRHMVIRTQELSNRSFTKNSLERCYFCKRELFQELTKLAARHHLKHVVDASNVSDKKDFRPGNRAKEELGVRSPLSEAGFTKDDIRALSKKLKLSTWNKPALACLASRLPYGTEVSVPLLRQIANAERLLKSAGLTQVRLRHYGDLCRIEVARSEIPRLITKNEAIVRSLKKLGFKYITVDLEGYRTGSLNPALARKGWVNEVKRK